MTNALDQTPAVTETPVAAAVVETPVVSTPEEKPVAVESETKPKEEVAVVPQKYDLKLPENSLLDQSAVERLSLLAKEKGLSNEQAQAILNEQSVNVASFIEERKASWFEATKADKELGGDNLGQVSEMSKRVVERFGSQSLKDELNKTGYGNHPELVRLLNRIGKSMSEDQLIMPGAQAATKQKTAENILYNS